MNILKLVKHINLTTDEDFTFDQVIAFINDGIAKINAECGAIYPFIADLATEVEYTNLAYVDLPETWIRSLLIPFASGRIKENDSSQFEYNDWYGQFENNLMQFKATYEIPVEYVDLDASGNLAVEDYSLNVFTHLKGW